MSSATTQPSRTGATGAYVCPKCGERWPGWTTRCIGTAVINPTTDQAEGEHPPVFPVAKGGGR